MKWCLSPSSCRSHWWHLHLLMCDWTDHTIHGVSTVLVELPLQISLQIFSGNASAPIFFHFSWSVSAHFLYSAALGSPQHLVVNSFGAQFRKLWHKMATSWRINSYECNKKNLNFSESSWARLYGIIVPCSQQAVQTTKFTASVFSYVLIILSDCSYV